MIDNPTFSIIVLALILWLLADDIRQGLRESGIDFTRRQPARVLVEAPREEATTAAAGKALGIR